MSHRRRNYHSHRYRRSPSPGHRQEHRSRSYRSRSPDTNATHRRHSQRRRRHHRASSRRHVRGGYRRSPSPYRGRPKDRRDNRQVTTYYRRRSPQHHYSTPRRHTSRYTHHSRHHYDHHRRHHHRQKSQRPNSISAEPSLKMKSPSVSPCVRKSSHSPSARYLLSSAEPYHIIPSQPLHISVTLPDYNGARYPVSSPLVGRDNKVSREITPTIIAGTRRKVPMVPMTKEEHDRRQAVVREVRDPLTGRIRLVKGEGEILERIVSREEQRRINKMATATDGLNYQMCLYHV
ncbi:ADP-ribosylation factor-like protein 6-interacting protein 4, partial [Dispira parvispora]